jgi:RNA polymerase sigma factor (sigma-70 family)
VDDYPSAHGEARLEPDFEAFYRATARGVLNAAIRVGRGDVELAREAMQEAFLAIWLMWDERQSHPLVDNRRYVTKIAANKAVDRLRQSRRWEPLSDEALDAHAPLSSRVSTDRAFEAAEVGLAFGVHQARNLRQAIDAMPPKLRSVAELYLIAEFDYDEIAKIMGTERSTVRSQVQRVRQLLRPIAEQARYLVEGGEA